MNITVQKYSHLVCEGKLSPYILDKGELETFVYSL